MSSLEMYGGSGSMVSSRDHIGSIAEFDRWTNIVLLCYRDASLLVLAALINSPLSGMERQSCPWAIAFP